jgi:hypothetical protein
VSLQITYKYLPPSAEPTEAELSKAELVSVRQVADGEETPRQEIGEVIRVRDSRHADEARSFEVVKVSATPAVSGFLGEPSAMIDNIEVYVTDAE